MALLIFPPENINMTPQLAGLLDPSLRQSVASRVNEAILASQGARREARIKSLVRCRAWSEQKAREAKKDIPLTISLGLDGDGQDESDGGDQEDEDDDEVMNGNGEATFEQGMVM